MVPYPLGIKWNNGDITVEDIVKHFKNSLSVVKMKEFAYACRSLWIYTYNCEKILIHIEKVKPKSDGYDNLPPKLVKV